MYDNAISARDAGVNFAFLSGNSVWGVIPMLPSSKGQPYRVIRREDKFIGEELSAMLNKQRGTKQKYPAGPDAGLLMGGITAGIGGGPWTCVNPDHWLYEGTGMKEGDMIEGLVGWEWHGRPAKDLPGMEFVAHSETRNGAGKPQSPHIATIYDGPKGNVVFNAGSIWWAQGLSSPPGHVLPAHKAAQPQGPDPRVQRMMSNVFDRFIQ